jgi:hypothetical protein
MNTEHSEVEDAITDQCLANVCEEYETFNIGPKKSSDVQQTTEIMHEESVPAAANPTKHKLIDASIPSAVGPEHSGSALPDHGLVQTDTPMPAPVDLALGQKNSLLPKSEDATCTPTEDEINKFIYQQRPKNTTIKTSSDVKKLESYLCDRGDSRKLHDIPPEELNSILRPFFLGLRRKSGTEFEPSSLDSIYRSIDRYLRDFIYPKSLIHVHVFQSTRALLSAKKKQLVEVYGKGQRPNAAVGLTFAEEEQLWEANKLGNDNPQSLLNTVWYQNNFFGFRARDEHHKLKLGDIVSVEDDLGKYIECAVDRGSKNRPAAEIGSGNPKKMKYVKPRLYENKQNPSRCPVAIHDLYVNKRPDTMQDP